MEFYLRDRHRVVVVKTGAEHWAQRCVLVGPSTHRMADLKQSGSLRVFSIRFSPVGLRALFCIPARLLRNQALEAEDVLGPEIAEVHEQLAAGEPMRWESIAEGYLLKRARALVMSGEFRIAAQVAARMQRSRGVMGVAEAAAASAMSMRHLEGHFRSRLGFRPGSLRGFYVSIMRWN